MIQSRLTLMTRGAATCRAVDALSRASFSIPECDVVVAWPRREKKENARWTLARSRNLVSGERQCVEDGFVGCDGWFMELFTESEKERSDDGCRRQIDESLTSSLVD